MNKLLSTVFGVVQDARYSARFADFDGDSIICFEDDSSIGFIKVFSSAKLLLGSWQELETALIRRFATSFRAAGEKAWNVYLVMLCDETTDSNTDRTVRWIEEDLRYTRKLTGTGIVTRDDAIKILLPILPIQFQPALVPTDFEERIRNRIDVIATGASSYFFNNDVPPVDVVRLLSDSP